jgi:hypothetical protein
MGKNDAKQPSVHLIPGFIKWLVTTGITYVQKNELQISFYDDNSHG